MEHILPQIKDQLVRLLIGWQHTNLLEVTAVPSLIYILLLYAVKGFEDVRAVKHNKLVVHALGEVIEVLTQRLPAPLPQSQALQLGMGPVGKTDTDHICEGVGCDGRPVAKL